MVRESAIASFAEKNKIYRDFPERGRAIAREMLLAFENAKKAYFSERRVIDRRIQFCADNETPLEEEHPGVTIVLIPFNIIVANCQSAKQCTPSLEGGNVKDTLLWKLIECIKGINC